MVLCAIRRTLSFGVRRFQTSFSNGSLHCNCVRVLSAGSGTVAPVLQSPASAPIIADARVAVLACTRRSVFQNKKTFHICRGTQEDSDVSAAKGRLLFSDTDTVPLPSDAKLPSVSELDSILPSLHQLRGEIPSSVSVEEHISDSEAHTKIWEDKKSGWDVDDDDDD